MCLQEELQILVAKYNQAKASGQLDNSSEETVRMWINEFLLLFGWDVKNTHQVLQERILDKSSRNRLREIDSTNIKPDYTLVSGNLRLAFVDAKSLDVDIENDSKVAFQIRSYGWSAGTLFSFVTNFESIAIYDCTIKPSINDNASIARLYFFKIDDYVDNISTLSTYLSKQSVQQYPLVKLSCPGIALDREFANYLRDFRVRLVEDILSHRQGYSLETLSIWSQIIIDRIIFIRVCEARGLEREGLLKEYQKNGFWQNFKRSAYVDFYQHYDGPIFDRILPINALNISDAIFDDLLSALYYPSPYRFDVIPINVLSSIYELFLGYKLEIYEGHVVSVLKESLKKQNGVVVTPLHIVRKVLDCTFNKNHISRLSFEELLRLKILDPACGSGIFIVEVLSLLESYAIQSLREDDERIIQIGEEKSLNLLARKQIATSCLYGVDIDQEAVEVTKLSIALRLIDGYTPDVFEKAGLLGSQILSGIGENIKCGNSLVSSDILDMYPSLRDCVDELKETNIFDWSDAFPAVFAQGGFDFVIGNPPYVEVKNYNVGLPTMASYIKNHYPSSKNGKIDLAIPFIEQGLSLLNERGRLGYIVQKRFFKTDYGKKIREIIANEQILNNIYDYLETDLFPDRITYVAILVCDKCKEHNTSIAYSTSDEDSRPIMFPQNFAREPIWDFSNPELTKWRIDAVNRLGTLGDACNIKVGIQVLYDGIYQIRQGCCSGNMIEGQSETGDVIVEQAACRPLLCNENFKPFIKPVISTFAIFPYRTMNGEVERIKFSEYKRLYPQAARYLEKNKHLLEDVVQLFPSLHKDASPNESWHYYTREQNHKEYTEKLCIPMTSQYPEASVILDGRVYCDNANMYFVTIPNNCSLAKLYALAAIINSSWFATIARSIANPQQNGYFKFNKQFLDPLPFPCESFKREDKNIKELASIAKKIEEINLCITNNPTSKGNFTKALVSLWKELDEKVEDLYGIAGDSILAMKTSRTDRI